MWANDRRMLIKRLELRLREVCDFRMDSTGERVVDATTSNMLWCNIAKTKMSHIKQSRNSHVLTFLVGQVVMPPVEGLCAYVAEDHKEDGRPPDKIHGREGDSAEDGSK
uniref:Reverse transcriptase domain-containing protein n=1 Tax=Steinernema glaseri TaxID=37863 RepID=A0A1I7ZN19_9BILA